MTRPSRIAAAIAGLLAASAQAQLPPSDAVDATAGATETAPVSGQSTPHQDAPPASHADGIPAGASTADVQAAGASASEATSQAALSARDAREPASRTLSTVNVTAKGYESQSAETPVATSVIDRAELARQQSQTVCEALRNQPGLSVATDSAHGKNPVIRGLSKDSIVLLVDGMRFNSAQPVGAIGSFVSMGLADRVEVVKGPASVLYGTGALGGAINVQLPQARFEPGVGLRAQAGYDSASRGLHGAAVGNFSQGDHAVMLGLSAASYEDYEAPGGKVANTGYDSRAFIGQYRYRLDGQQQLRLSAQQDRQDDVWYPGSTRPHPLAQAVGTITTHSPRQERTLYEVGYSRKAVAAGDVNIDARVYRQEMHRTIYVRSSLLGRDIVTNDDGRPRQPPGPPAAVCAVGQQPPVHRRQGGGHGPVRAG